MKIIIFSALGLLSFEAFCQQIIHAAGNTSETDQVSMTWTIGETVNFTGQSGEAILTQGFNQSNFIITSLFSGLDGKTRISLFPNPSPDEVNIRSAENDRIESIIVTDINGIHLLTINPGKQQHSIDLSSFSATTVIVSVKTTNKDYSTFKVLKLK